MSKLPQIPRRFAGEVATGLSDRALLRRYCAGGDESAFAVLMARHGPMVLSICRSVLRDKADSEDAFQAVFLVFVRRAGAIWVDVSLGGWLHGLAYQVALRADAEASRRRTRERTDVPIEVAEVGNGTALDSRLAALHEEIARLPESHRQALVLCLLEGKTQAEAAKELGCGEATVQRRLDKARERLHARFDQDHLDLLTPASLSAVPTALAATTVRVAAGPLTPLAASVLDEMVSTHTIRTAIALIAIGLGTAYGLGVLLAHRPQNVQGLPPNAAAAQVAPAQPESGLMKIGQQPEGEVVVSGQVVGPDGKPFAGSTVFLRALGVGPSERKAATDAEGRFRFTTQHELGWSMTETAPGRLLMDAYPDADEVRNLKPRLIAVAPGFGFGLPVEGDEVKLRLAADEPIVGRVTDREGRPVAGARVRARNIYWLKRLEDKTERGGERRASLTEELGGSGTGFPSQDLAPWIEVVRRATRIDEIIDANNKLLTPLVAFAGDVPAAHAPIVPPVTTDAEGRFRLVGIGRERVAEVIIDGPEIASSLIVAATRPIEKPIHVPAQAPTKKDLLANARDDLTVFGHRVEHVAGPGRAVVGVVSDRDTGKPLAGLVVHGPWRSRLEEPDLESFRSTTDDQGRYRIEGLPVPSEGRLTIDPPEDRPYLGRSGMIEIEPGPVPLKIDVGLRRGVWITGNVVDDASTDQAPSGFIHYYAFSDNPFLRKDLDAGFAPKMRRVRTDNMGNFRIAGYPGRGIVTAWNSLYLTGVGADTITGLKKEQPSDQFYPAFEFSPGNVSAVVEVDVAEGAESVACELKLKQGKSREVQVVGPDGKPQPGTEASGLRSQVENPMTGVAGDRFLVSNLVPGESREVVVRLVSKKWVGKTTVTHQGDWPVALRLRPWATLNGRLVDDQGRPLAKAVEVQLDDGKLPLHTLGGRGYDRPAFPIDPDGRFRIEGLVAGSAYGLEALEGGVKIIGKVAAGLVLEPGETRDLGDVKVGP